MKTLRNTFILLTLTLFACSEDESFIENKSKDIEPLISKIAVDLNANITFDDKINESNAIVINSEKEYRDFITKIKNQIKANELSFVNSNDANQTRIGCADGVYSGSGLTSGYATLNFDVSVTDGCISDINGGFVGFTLGVSYTQGGTSYGCNTGRVCGSVNYNLFFEGAGTIYSERICYNITLNC